MPPKKLGNENFPPLTKPLSVDDDIIGPHMSSVNAGIETLGTADRNVGRVRDRLQTTANNPSNKKETREKAKKNLGVLKDLEEGGHIPTEPLTRETAIQRGIDTIHRNIKATRSKSFVAGTGQRMYGAGWYFQHNREGIDPASHLSSDTQAAMGAVMSAGKTPEDERVAMHAVRELADPDVDHTITVNKKTAASLGGNIPHGTSSVRNLSPEQVGTIAAAAASENSEIASGKRSSRTRGIKSTGDIVGAGRVHRDNISAATEISRMRDPWEYFDPATRPKTLSYGKDVADAGDSNEETDFLSIASHISSGADPNQGMFMFSRTDPDRDYNFDEDGSPSIFSTERDTPQDQWMMAGRSGAPNMATRELTDKRGRKSNRSYSPSKRIVDADMPGGLDNLNKEDLGLPNDPRVTVEGVAHAFHNDVSKEVARRWGPVSFDQFGNDINFPSMLEQEAEWSQNRNEAGGNKALNAEQKEWDNAVKAEAKEKARLAKGNAKIAGTQDSLFD